MKVPLEMTLLFKWSDLMIFSSLTLLTLEYVIDESLLSSYESNWFNVPFCADDVFDTSHDELDWIDSLFFGIMIGGNTVTEWDWPMKYDYECQ